MAPAQLFLSEGQTAEKVLIIKKTRAVVDKITSPSEVSPKKPQIVVQVEVAKLASYERRDFLRVRRSTRACGGQCKVGKYGR